MDYLTSHKGNLYIVGNDPTIYNDHEKLHKIATLTNDPRAFTIRCKSKGFPRLGEKTDAVFFNDQYDISFNPKFEKDMKAMYRWSHESGKKIYAYVWGNPHFHQVKRIYDELERLNYHWNDEETKEGETPKISNIVTKLMGEEATATYEKYNISNPTLGFRIVTMYMDLMEKSKVSKDLKINLLNWGLNGGTGGHDWLTEKKVILEFEREGKLRIP